MGGHVLPNRTNRQKEVLSTWKVGELQQVSNRDLHPANKVGLNSEDGPQGVLNHPDRLSHLHLEGATWVEGEDKRLGPVNNLPVEVASRVNKPVPSSVRGSQDNFLEDQKWSVKS